MSANTIIWIEPDLAFEIIKLLLQVAWADHEIAEEEIEHIRTFGQNYRIPEDNMKVINDCLEGNAQLPPPDFGLLRQHKDTVLRHAQALVNADDTVARAENDIMAEIELLLG